MNWLTARLRHWPRLAYLGLQCLLSTWTVSGDASPPVTAIPVIPPGSPPSELQRQFAQRPAGMLVFEAPEQSPVADFQWFKRGAFELAYTDRIFMRGLVLSVQPYHAPGADDMAEISPMDMVIGWQHMSDPAIVSQIHIRQRDRFYYWRVEAFPIPRDDIERSSTNVHIIANSPQQVAELLAVKPGDLVSLQGYLVDVKKPDGFIWTTSRVRDDHGDGACEILLVEHISIITPEPPPADTSQR